MTKAADAIVNKDAVAAAVAIGSKTSAATGRANNRTGRVRAHPVAGVLAIRCLLVALTITSMRTSFLAFSASTELLRTSKS